MGLRGHRAEEGARVAAPAAIRAFVVRNQRAGQLFDVVVFADFAEQVPARRVRLEWIEDHIAPLPVVETTQVAAVRIGDYGAVAATECGTEQLVNGGAPSSCGRT